MAHRQPTARCHTAKPADESASAPGSPIATTRPPRTKPRHTTSSKTASTPRASQRTTAARPTMPGRTRGMRPPARRKKTAAPATGPIARRGTSAASAIGDPTDRDRVQRRLVDAVQAEELVGPAIVEAAERDRSQPERGRRQHEVLAHVAGLEECKPIAAEAVLETSAPEDGRNEDDHSAARDDLRIGRERCRLIGRESGTKDFEARPERVEVVEAGLQPLDAEGADVELERVERPAGGDRAQREGLRAGRRLECAGDAVARLEERRELVAGDRLVSECTLRPARTDRLPERKVGPARRREHSRWQAAPFYGTRRAELKIGARLQPAGALDLAPDLGGRDLRGLVVHLGGGVQLRPATVYDLQPARGLPRDGRDHAPTLGP